MSSAAVWKCRSLLEEGLGQLGHVPAHGQLEALMTLASLLEHWSCRFNLTAHRDLEAIIRRLILDAAALDRELPQATALVDLGSGAGLPGLPLAVLRPGCLVQLVESRERRHHFQRAAIRELGLGNVQAVRGRAERLVPRHHDLVVAQGIARPDAALTLMLPWTAPGGWLAIPGGASPPRLAGHPEVQAVESRSYQVPCDGPRRTVWLGQRAAGGGESAGC